MARYVPRIVDQELDELLLGLAAIAIEGPKAVGKTETAERRAQTVFRLDDPGTREIVGGDPARLTAGPSPTLIDEWQRFPPSWDLVRRAVDRDATPGQFLLTGSATPAAGAIGHSGAGRIVTVRMRPMSLAERYPGVATVSLTTLLSGSKPALDGATALTLSDYAEEIVGSGFPEIRSLTGRARRRQLDGYLDRIVERDFDDSATTFAMRARCAAGSRRTRRQARPRPRTRSSATRRRRDNPTSRTRRPPSRTAPRLNSSG